MKLTTIASGSKGNCYVLHTNDEALVLEAGMPAKLAIQVVKYHLPNIKGVLVTHEHKDHAKYAGDYLKRAIPVYTSAGTIGKLNIQSHHLYEVEENRQYEIGGFTVMPFKVKHDAEEPFGYYIHHPEMGYTLFATDTYLIPVKFEEVNNLVIECNYDPEILEQNKAKGLISSSELPRITQAHMSLDTCITTLKSMKLTYVNNIVLCHVSSRNGYGVEEKVREAVGRAVYVAKAGEMILFDREPF
jgi:phosphoribosyl 1,2-cyclic phosphodiesterase